MNCSPPTPKLRAGTGFLLVALLAAPIGFAQAETLRDVFEKTWANSPQGKTVVAKREEANASRTVAESLFPGTPRIGLAQRTDRWNDNLGKEESEIGISVPLWLPGQKSARIAVAEADSDESQRSIAATRLAVAGELRTALWTLYLAQSEAAVAGERLDAAAKLEADVARRVKVGEMARSDLLLVKQETSSARAAAAEANARVVRSTQRYRVLTGSDRLPDNPQEPVMAAAAEDIHPRLAAGQAIAERARAGMKLAQESRRDAPSIGMQYRRERDASGATPRDSVGFAITIPFAGEVRNAPLIASANTALIQADAQYQRLLAEVEAEAREAEAQLDAARIGAEIAVDREQAAAERLSLMRRSFELGETALVELLRAQSQAPEARIELGRSRARLSAAQANLNQARGITP